MFQFRKSSKSISENPTTNEDGDEMKLLQSMTTKDIISSVTINSTETVDETKEEKITVDETIFQTESSASEIIENSSANTVNNVVEDEGDMEKTINVKDIMAKIADFLGGQTSKETVSDKVSDKPVEENGVEMTQEQKDELLKVQEDLKLAEAKALAEAEAKAELQKQIDAMNAEKEAEKIKAEKEQLSTMVKDELSFVGGTLEENTDKLFELKSSLGEDKAELFDFVVNSLKKTSAIVEESLDESGSNPKKEEMLSVEEKVDKMVADKMEKNPSMKESVAYVAVLDENPELKQEIYSNIGKVKETEESEEE